MALSSQPDPSQSGPRWSTSALEARLDRPPARLHLAQLPTPVARVPWLDTPSAEAWIKRDDATSDLYGGGKVRKLEWVLANAPYAGDQPIVSVGGVGSHHLLALALFLERQKRQLHALTFSQTLTPHVRLNLAALLSLGVQLWHVERRVALPWAWLRYRGWQRPSCPGTYLAAGASTPLGCLGFVEAGLELAEQIEAKQLPAPARVYVTAGSAGTAAGLVIGLALAGVSTHLHLVSSVESWAFNRLLFGLKLRQAFSVLERAGLRDDASSVSALVRRAGVTWTIDHSEVGGGYGVPTPDGEWAVREAAEHGLRLETTYTAKCIAAMRRAEAQSPTAGPILFWNTHGGNDLSRHIKPGWEARSPITL